jgi:hypothetical protein
MPRLDVELLLLPLRHFGKTHSLALGALTPVNEPDWLGRKSAPALHVNSMRVIDAAARARPALVLHEGGRRVGVGI